MHHVYEGTFGARRGHQIPLELELQVAENHLMVTQVPLQEQ